MIGKIIKIAGKKYKVVARTSGNEYTLEVEEVIENKDDKFTEIIADIEALSNRMDKLESSVNKIYKLTKALYDAKFDNHVEG
jgi:hypothetical protein